MNAPTPVDDSTLVGAVLFTDLVGFTEFNDTAGDAAALQVLDHQTELMAAILADCADARIVKELGDGMLVWFAEAIDAIEGSTAMLVAVEMARTESAFPVAIRMGLHHGEMLARGDDLVGATVNIAARIAALAGPGELLASEVVIEACDGQLPAAEMDPVGPALVKGVADPVWLVRVSAVETVAPRSLA